MSLQDLVTEGLPEELGRERTLLEISEEFYEPNSTFHNLKEALSHLGDKGWSRPLSEAVLRLMRRDRDRGRAGQELLLALLEAQDGSPSGLEGAIDRVLPSVEEDVIFQSSADVFRYCEEVWGDDTAEILSRATGVKKNTASRWMSGGNMSRRKYNSISSAILLYRAALAKGLTPADARRWLLEGKQLPLEKIAQSRLSSFRWIPWDAAQALGEIDPE
jgi:hypothetical protein